MRVRDFLKHLSWEEELAELYIGDLIMSQVTTKQDLLAELRRFFKNYSVFCQSPDPDAVREVLASIYSVNDKAKKVGYPNFFDSDEFIAIKAIRNYMIHQGEIYNEAKSLPLVSKFPIDSELNFLCLVPFSIMEILMQSSKARDQDALKATCVFYNEYVDIYPCIFNFGVQLYLYTEEHNLFIESKEYSEFKNSIEYERRMGLSHFVKGGIVLRNGNDVNDFLKNELQTIERRNELQQKFYIEEKGIFTFSLAKGEE